MLVVQDIWFMRACISPFKSLLSGDGGQGFGLAAGWHGDVCQRRFLCGEAAADVGGHHGAGNHQTAAGGHLEVRTHTDTHTLEGP